MRFVSTKQGQGFVARDGAAAVILYSYRGRRGYPVHARAAVRHKLGSTRWASALRRAGSRGSSGTKVLVGISPRRW